MHKLEAVLVNKTIKFPETLISKMDHPILFRRIDLFRISRKSVSRCCCCSWSLSKIEWKARKISGPEKKIVWHKCNSCIYYHMHTFFSVSRLRSRWRLMPSFHYKHIWNNFHKPYKVIESTGNSNQTDNSINKIKPGGVLSIIVIVVRNGIVDTSSNLWQGYCSHPGYKNPRFRENAKSPCYAHVYKWISAVNTQTIFQNRLILLAIWKPFLIIG